MKQQIASLGSRLVAALVDGLIYVNLVVMLAARVVEETEVAMVMDRLMTFLAMIIVVGPLVLPWFMAFLVSGMGGGIGKLITGLEVVDEKGERISYWRAFFRNQVGRAVSGLVFGAGYAYMFKDKERRGWHDHISGTYVVNRGNGNALVGVFVALALVAVLGLMLRGIVIRVGENMPVYEEVVGEMRDEFEGAAKKI